MEAGLVHQLVEHLAVLLPEGAAVVHPFVDDRLRVEAVRRHGAAHGHSPPSRVSMAYQRVRGRWPKVLDGRTPLIRLDAETAHAVKVHYGAGQDSAAAM